MLKRIKNISKFDHVSYWLDRHKKYKNDWRSVGQISLSDEENRKGSVKLVENLKNVILSLYPNPAGLSVLDFACGIGRLAPFFLEMKCDYLGLDISPDAVEQARKYCPNAKFKVGDITSSKPEESPFDIVIASYVLVHMVDDNDWQAALDNLASVTMQNGLLLIIDNLPSRKNIMLASHAVRRSYSTYEKALKKRKLVFTKELDGKNPPDFYSIRLRK
ncbi:MAG: class I SAM-dependent methyltransferase [Candidatus Marinimicrobia bacterium]|nr:class I SAM-dependent methyltransferase [Candidatus Neomarinimicrobiota bacterium]